MSAHVLRYVQDVPLRQGPKTSQAHGMSQMWPGHPPGPCPFLKVPGAMCPPAGQKVSCMLYMMRHEELQYPYLSLASCPKLLQHRRCLSAKAYCRHILPLTVTSNRHRSTSISLTLSLCQAGI